MARPPRIERPGAWHHVTARGNERRAIYRGDRDRAHFCELLGEAVELFRWRLHAYVLMDNHFHLLVETPEPNLGRVMQWLSASYSVWFNLRHQRAGHLLQGRFKSIVVDPTGWALELSRYVHLNPVRLQRFGLDKSARQRDGVGAGAEPDAQKVKERISRLRSYRWSSYRAYAGLEERPKWLNCEGLLALGGNRQEKPRAAYRRYVEQAVRQGLPESPWENLRDRVVLGGADFARAVSRAAGLGRKADGRRRRLGRPTTAEIIAAVEQIKGEAWEAFRDRHNDWGRDLAFYVGRKDWAIGLRELGEAAGGVDALAVSVATRRLARKIERTPELSAALAQARQKLQMSNVEH